jgi:twitching motility protein PilJ
MSAPKRTRHRVLAQQKMLTQVGASLRTDQPPVRRPAGNCRGVSSLKLQQNAPAGEISAAGQLVMLTQRIGKSSNEFLTMEGVSPRPCSCWART